MLRRKYELYLRFVEVEEVVGIGEDQIILDEWKLASSEYKKTGEQEPDKEKMLANFQSLITTAQGFPTIKAFRIVGMASDYPVLFLHFNINDQDKLPLGLAMHYRGFGDPSKFLFMWVLSTHSAQEIYYDWLGGHGSNVPIAEYRSIFEFVSHNWDELEHGAVLEMFSNEEDSFNPFRLRKTNLRFTDEYNAYDSPYE